MTPVLVPLSEIVAVLRREADRDPPELGFESLRRVASELERRWAEGDAEAPSNGEEAPDAPVNFEHERRYWSDDRDLEGHDLDLAVSMGGNGDWYVSIVRHGERTGPYVRLTTSGTPSNARGVPTAVARLYRALPATADGRR